MSPIANSRTSSWSTPTMYNSKSKKQPIRRDWKYYRWGGDELPPITTKRSSSSSYRPISRRYYSAEFARYVEGWVRDIRKDTRWPLLPVSAPTPPPRPEDLSGFPWFTSTAQWSLTDFPELPSLADSMSKWPPSDNLLAPSSTRAGSNATGLNLDDYLNKWEDEIRKPLLSPAAAEGVHNCGRTNPQFYVCKTAKRCFHNRVRPYIIE